MNRKERRRAESRGEVSTAPDTRALNSAKARARAAEKRLQAGDTQGAAAAIKEALRFDPVNAQAWYLQAMMDFNAGRLEEASDAIIKASMGNNADANVHANCAAIMNVCGRPMEAEAAARCALDQNADMPEAYCNLGVALEAQGKFPDAVEALQKAISLRPNYAEALISLGNLYFRAGNHMAGAEAFAEAVRGQPTNVMARTNLAVALRHLGELGAAERQCLEAIALDRSYAEAHNALGNVLMQLGDLPGAVKSFGTAVKLRDPYPEAQANLAAALFKTGDLDAAEERYLDIIERHPTFAEATHGLGVVLLAAGRIDDAERRFRRAVEIRPGLGEAWMNIVDAKGSDLADEDLATIREKSEDTRLPEEDRIGFLFALGAAEDARGNYAAAAKAYREANDRRLLRAEADGTAFDGDAFDAEIDSVVETMTAEVIGRHKGLGDPEAGMIFVCGMPRSGTTLVEQMLAAHPMVSGAGEVDIISGMLDDYPGDVPALSADDIRHLAATYLARLAVQPKDCRMVTDKTPQNVFFLGLIKILFPKAKVIRCRRDERDTALSCYFQNFRSVGLDWSSRLSDIERYAAAEARMTAHWQGLMGDDILEVAYEDVIADPEATGRRLIAHVGLAWDDAVASPHTAGGTVLTASNWQVRKPIYATSMGRWKNYSLLLNPGA